MSIYSIYIIYIYIDGINEKSLEGVISENAIRCWEMVEVVE